MDLRLRGFLIIVLSVLYLAWVDSGGAGGPLFVVLALIAIPVGIGLVIAGWVVQAKEEPKELPPKITVRSTAAGLRDMTRRKRDHQ